MTASKEEEKKKIDRKWNRSFYWSCTAMIPAFLGMFIFGKSKAEIYEKYQCEQYKTPVVEQHIATGKTLSNLRWKFDKINENLPDQTEARNYALARASALEGAIAEIKADSIEIAENPQVKEYFRQKEAPMKHEGKKSLYGYLMMIAGLIIFCSSNHGIYKRREKELAELEKNTKYLSKE